MIGVLLAWVIGALVTLWTCLHVLGQRWAAIKKACWNHSINHGTWFSLRRTSYNARVIGCSFGFVGLALLTSIAWPVVVFALPFLGAFLRGERKTAKANALSKRNAELEAELDAIAKKEGLA